MKKKKNKTEFENNANVKLETKTIISNNPFNEHDFKIIDFMATISKNIYNCSVFCHQVYDLFFPQIYTELNTFVTKTKDITLNLAHNKLFILLDKYYDIYVDNITDFKNNNDLIWKYISMINKAIPIINSNYDQVVEDTYKYVFSCKEIKIKPEFKDFIYGQIIKLINYFYCVNYNETKQEMLEKKPVKIQDTSFIEDIKNNICKVGDNKRGKFKEEINEFFQLKQIENTKKTNNRKSKKGKKSNKKPKPKWASLYSDQNIIKLFTYAHIGKNKDKLPADIVLNIINKAYDAYISLMELRTKGIKTNQRKFLSKHGRFNLFYTKASREIIKIKKKYYVRLNVGAYISQKYIEITGLNKLVCINKESKKKVDENKIYVNDSLPNKCIINKKRSFMVGEREYNIDDKNLIHANFMYIRLPNKLIKRDIVTKEVIFKDISLIEIVQKYDGHTYEVHYKYKTEKTQILENDEKNIDNYAFGDTGVVNMLAMYDPTGNTQNIISGGQINTINSFYYNKIDMYKSIAKKVNKKDTSRRIRDLFIRRENAINKYFADVCEWFLEKYKHKKYIVIGYNINWKKEVNMGRENNRKFYDIPYKKMLEMLKNKLNKAGIKMILTEESYTSKCDALALESIEYHEEYEGNRESRGLYASSTGKLINADMNGAINIGIKYMRKIGINIDIIKGEGIYNPKKIRRLGSLQENH